MTTSLLVGAWPGSWREHNGQGADKHGGHMDVGSSDVAGAGTMWWMGDVPGGGLGLSWFVFDTGSCRLTIGPWHGASNGVAGTMGKQPAT